MKQSTILVLFATQLLVACVSTAPTSPLRAGDDVQLAASSHAVSYAPTSFSEPSTEPLQPLAATGLRADRAWSFLIQPYALLASIEGTAGVGRVSGAPVDVGFSDILDTLDMGGMLHTEAYHRSGWGVMLDYGFMELGAERSGAVVLDADLRQGTLEAFVARRWTIPAGTVELFGGVRWWDIDIDLSLSPGPLGRSVDVDWVDPVVGARLFSSISDDWTIMSRLDFGGFGIESDFSWTLALGAIYRMNENVAFEVQYKALFVDYNEGTQGTSSFFAYDTVTHGPLLGVSFQF